VSDRAPQDVEVELVGGRKVLARYRPVSNGGLSLISEDITGIRRMEVTLKEEEERYKLVTRALRPAGLRGRQISQRQWFEVHRQAESAHRPAGVSYMPFI
jgi:hypothetical protein